MRAFTLRPSDAPVKSENGKAVAGWRASELCETILLPVLDGDDSLVGLDVDARGTSSSFR